MPRKSRRPTQATAFESPGLERLEGRELPSAIAAGLYVPVSAAVAIAPAPSFATYAATRSTTTAQAPGFSSDSALVVSTRDRSFEGSPITTNGPAGAATQSVETTGNISRSFPIASEGLSPTPWPDKGTDTGTQGAPLSSAFESSIVLSANGSSTVLAPSAPARGSSRDWSAQPESSTRSVASIAQTEGAYPSFGISLGFPSGVFALDSGEPFLMSAVAAAHAGSTAGADVSAPGASASTSADAFASPHNEPVAGVGLTGSPGVFGNVTGSETSTQGSPLSAVSAPLPGSSSPLGASAPWSVTVAPPASLTANGVPDGGLRGFYLSLNTSTASGVGGAETLVSGSSGEPAILASQGMPSGSSSPLPRSGALSSSGIVDLITNAAPAYAPLLSSAAIPAGIVVSGVHAEQVLPALFAESDVMAVHGPVALLGRAAPLDDESGITAPAISTTRNEPLVATYSMKAARPSGSSIGPATPEDVLLSPLPAVGSHPSAAPHSWLITDGLASGGITSIATGTPALVSFHDDLSRIVMGIASVIGPSSVPGEMRPNPVLPAHNGQPVSSAAVLDEALEAESLPPSHAADLLSSFSPFQRGTLESAFDRFLGQLGDLDVNITEIGETRNVIPEVLAVLVGIALAHVLQRRAHQLRGESSSPRTLDEDSSLPGFPGLPGGWSSDEV